MPARKPIAIGQLIENRPIGGFQWLVVGLCALIAFLDGFDTQVMALSVPAIAKDWGVARSGFGLALSASLIGLGVGAAILAPLGDKLGRRPMLIWSMLLIGLSTVAIAAAPDVWWMIGLRFLTGIGLGVSIANSTAMVADYLPVAKRSALVTLVFCTSAIGSILAGVAAPYLIDGFGWHMVFIAGGVPAIVVAAILAPLLPESVRILLARKPEDPRIPRLLARLAPGEPLPPIVADPVVVGERTSLLGLLTPGLMPRTLTIWAIFALNLFAVYLVVSWAPTLLIGAGWPQESALHAAAGIQFGGLIGGLPIAYVATRGWLRQGLSVAFLLAAVCLLLFFFVPPTILLWTILLILVGCGTCGTQFALNGLAAAVYPASIRATGHGWALVIGRVSAIAAPLLGGALIAGGVTPNVLFGFLTIPLGICAVLAMVVRRRWLQD